MGQARRRQGRAVALGVRRALTALASFDRVITAGCGPLTGPMMSVVLLTVAAEQPPNRKGLP